MSFIKYPKISAASFYSVRVPILYAVVFYIYTLSEQPFIILLIKQENKYKQWLLSFSEVYILQRFLFKIHFLINLYNLFYVTTEGCFKIIACLDRGVYDLYFQFEVEYFKDFPSVRSSISYLWIQKYYFLWLQELILPIIR